MSEKLEGPFKELPYHKVLNALVSTSKVQGPMGKELQDLKKTLIAKFGKVQTQVFFDSLPKSAYPQDKDPATAKFYALPKAKPSGNNKGGLIDYRKKGLFR